MQPARRAGPAGTGDLQYADIRTGALLAGALSGAAIHNFIGVACFALLGLSTILYAGRNVRISPLLTHTAFITLVVCALGVLPNATPFPVRFEEMVRFSSYALLAIYLSFVSRRSILIAIAILLAVIMATLVIHLLTGSFAGRGDFGERKFSSIFIHANHLAYACSFMSLVGVIEILRGMTDRSQRWLALTIFCLSSFILVVARSSGGLLALVVGSGIAALTIGTSSRKLLFLVLFGVALFLIFTFTSAFETFAAKIELIDLHDILRRASEYKFGGGAGSLAWRLTYWKALYDAHIASGAFHVLFGMGGGASTEGNYPYFFMIRDPHNDFMKLFIEYGLVGVVLIVGTLVNLCRRKRELLPLFAALCIGMFSGNTIGAAGAMGIFFVCLSAYAPASYMIRRQHPAWRPSVMVRGAG